MITTELKESKDRLKELNNTFNLVESDWIEITILEIMAEEARFNALLRIARKEG